MTHDAGRRSRAALTIVSFFLITAAACSGLSLPGQSSGTGASGVPGASGPAVSIGSAKDLEALLPDQLCGQPAEKNSAAGSGSLPGASGSADPFGGIVGALGGTGSVGAAVVEPKDTSTCKVSAGAFQITGIGQGMLSTLLSVMAAGSGGDATNVNLGGKAVVKVSDQDTPIYVYAKGDIVFVVEAPTDDDAAPVLSVLP
jgi:hypothetical protein